MIGKLIQLVKQYLNDYMTFSKNKNNGI